MNKALSQFTVLILGGYGTFGSRIARGLCHKGFHVVINGRHHKQAMALQKSILKSQAQALVSVACFDVFSELAAQLAELKPDLVIHTCGPFQGQDTQIAQVIIESNCHYVDLSDGREYVGKMLSLNETARVRGITAITAASTVPALSSAALVFLQEKYQIEKFNSIRMGISPGQRSARGLATTRAVLSYIGKALSPWRGNTKKAYGWQNMYYQKYPHISNRLMGNCEAPDLDYLQDFLAIDKLQFSAGMESKLLHLLIWLCSWLIRLKLPLNLAHRAEFLLKVSHWFDVLGSEDGGMHIEFTGQTTAKTVINKTWYIEARNNDGPQIPAIPAILLAEKILTKQIPAGVHPCVNLLTLNEYLVELGDLDIHTTIK